MSFNLNKEIERLIGLPVDLQPSEYNPNQYTATIDLVIFKALFEKVSVDALKTKLNNTTFYDVSVTVHHHGGAVTLYPLGMFEVVGETWRKQ